RLVITDFWQADLHALLLQRFASRYPDIEFECMIAEDEDVIDLLQSGRAHVGVLRAQQHYPPDIHVQHLQVKAQMAIYLHRDHPL
ncbi:LysR family transcriptional regulator substrate-binding protein, partial [Erwinia amylovora]|uniref:LysR family transcriptional regulator substrate-binding protein n=1 Tax=Erwinia amylovora TaxID=552 RepID=UPI0020C03A89